ncbi:MAG: acyl-CoA dehydrogenase family protein [Promethearchaeota archaeon]
MDFSLSEEQKLIQSTARKLSEEIIGPVAAEIDRESKPLPGDVMDKLAEFGVWGIQVPEEYGGAELDSVSYAIMIEEISKVSGTTGLTVTVHNSVATMPIYAWGSQEQRDKYVPDMAAGKRIGAFTMTEPNAGSDVAGLQMTAELDEDEWVLNGQKVFVTNGGIADVFLVGAKFDKDIGARGVGTFIVEKDSPGFTVGTVEDMLGMRGNMTSELYLENCRIPKENVLGGYDQLKNGFKLAMQALDTGRIGIAAQALGIGQAAFDIAMKYSLERQQFGKPIVSFQGVSFKLVEMATKLEAARLLIYKAADLKDKGKPFTKESAMCKWYASDVATRVCVDAIQVLGGYGYVKKHALERFYRDVKICEIYEGTNEIMKVIVANKLIREFS